jgi:hypothetical protein
LHHALSGTEPSSDRLRAGGLMSVGLSVRSMLPAGPMQRLSKK